MQAGGYGFESRRLHPTHKARTLANGIVGSGSGLVAVLNPVEGVSVDLRIEEHLKGPVVLDAQLVVLVDVDLGEERLVAQPPVGVVAARVDVGAVGEQSEGVVEVGAGVGVVAEVRIDAAVHLVEFGDDPVLFALEHGERDLVGVVRLHKAVLLAFEPVAVGGEAFQFLGFGGHQPVELVVEHPRECVLLGWRDLDAGVVVLDELLDVLDEHRLARAVGPLGVPTGAHEVAVDVAVAVLRIGDDEPGAALAAVDRSFEVVSVDLGCFDGALVRGEHGLNLVPDLGGHERGGWLPL